jgi:hypothetical protein
MHRRPVRDERSGIETPEKQTYRVGMSAARFEDLPDEELLEAWTTTVEEEPRNALLQVLQKKGLFPSSFIESWEHDTGAYPEYDDPRFLQKLLAKREFAESYQSTWRPTSDPCSDDANFETTAVQRFVANLMSPRSPYMSALLYHGVGVGKTCAAVQISEAWLESYPEDKVFLIAPLTIQEGFLRTIFDVNRLTLGSSEEGQDAEPNTLTGCTGSTYLELTSTLLERDIERIQRKVQQAIRRRYNIMGYITFANYIDRLTEGIDPELEAEERASKARDILRRHFSNRIIIIDEAHNLRDVMGETLVNTGPGGGDDKDAAEAGKLLTGRLQKVLDAAEGSKLVLLTATPMYNNYREIISLLNLLLRNDKKALLGEADLFRSNGMFRPASATHPGGAALIGQVARRYISFMRGENPKSFPIRLSPQGTPTVKDRPYPSKNPKGGVIPDSEKTFVKYLPLVAIELTGDSLAASQVFRSALKPGPTELTSMDIEKLVQAGNFIAPATATTASPTYENFRRRTELDGIEQILQKLGGTGGQEIQYKARVAGGASWLAAASLGQYAPKIVFLMNRLATCEGVAFVYSRFVGAGALPLALALEANGYTLAPGGGRKTRLLVDGVQDGQGRQCALCAKREVGHTGAHAFAPAYYGLLTGDELLTPRNKETIRVERNENNKDGLQMKVIIGSQIASEGVDFRFIREAHLLDSWYHLNKTEQVIGRAIRFCSHSLLPEENRNTTIYLYTAVYPDNAYETADLYSYRRAYLKALETGRVTRELKIHAIDCNLNRNAIVIEGEPLQTQTDSQRTKRPDVSVNDMPGTAICDWAEDCTYTCDPSIPMDSATIQATDDSTYSEFAAKWRMAALKNRFRMLFADRAFVSFERLWGDLFSDVPLVARKELFSMVVNNRSFRIEYKGQPGYIRYCNGYYVFQPELYLDTHIPLAIRAAAVPVRQDEYSPDVIVKPGKDKTKVATAAIDEPEGAAATEETEGATATVAKTAKTTVSPTVVEEWAAMRTWVLSMQPGAPYPLYSDLFNQRYMHLTGGDEELDAKYEKIREMFKWFHTSYFNTYSAPVAAAAVPRSTSSSIPLSAFHQAMLGYLWDNWFNYDEQVLLAGLDAGADQVRPDTHRVGSTQVVRIFNPSMADISYLCGTKACPLSIVEALEADATDPLKQLSVSKETTGLLYGFMATKLSTTRIVFKTNDQEKNKKKMGGAECSIITTTSVHHKMLYRLRDFLVAARLPDMDLRSEVIADKTSTRKLANATRICTIIELTLRLMDAARVSKKRWFYRPVAAFTLGHTFSSAKATAASEAEEEE